MSSAGRGAGRQADEAGPARVGTRARAAEPQANNPRRRRRTEEPPADQDVVMVDVDQDVEVVTVRTNPVVVDLTDTPGTAASQEEDVTIVAERPVRRRVTVVSRRSAGAPMINITIAPHAAQHPHHFVLSSTDRSPHGRGHGHLPAPATGSTHAVRNSGAAGPSQSPAAQGSNQVIMPANVPPNVARMLAEVPPSPPRPAFKCPICLESMEKVMSTPCGHLFCQDCITEALKARKQCPKCRKSCSARQVHRIFVE